MALMSLLDHEIRFSSTTLYAGTGLLLQFLMVEHGSLSLPKR